MTPAKQTTVRLLAAPSRSSPSVPTPDDDPDQTARPTDSLTARAASIYKARRQRARFFGQDADLFGEPVWDILLDLYVRIRQGQMTTVNSVCHASAVPSTTAARWVEVLVQRGLVIKTPHPDDRRCNLVWLTEDAMQALCRFMAEA